MFSEVNRLMKMDWGYFTPEFYLEKDKRMVHVFNHSLATDEEVDRTIRFISGRLEWLLGAELKHTVVIDDMGRNISKEGRQKIKAVLSRYADTVIFDSERGDV